jgi:hypothetical protein
VIIFRLNHLDVLESCGFTCELPWRPDQRETLLGYVKENGLIHKLINPKADFGFYCLMINFEQVAVGDSSVPFIASKVTVLTTTTKGISSKDSFLGEN